MSTATLFESARLVYVPANSSDIDEIVAMYQEPESQAAQMGDAIVPRPALSFREMVRGWMEKNPLAAIAKDKQTGAFIGSTSLREGEFPGELVLAVQVKKEHWGKGYGKEIVAWVVQHAFKWMPGTHRIALGVFESNARALGLYKSVGFVKEGVKRRARWANGKYEDVILMSILEDDFREGNRERTP